MYSIGELSRKAEVKVPTIRYYEQAGLMPEPERSGGNQRRYGRAELDRLTFIRHARALGLSLDEIRELLLLSNHPEEPCERADRIAAGHLASVRERIARLRKLESELERIVSHCEGHTIGDCYVIRALSDHGLCTGDHESA